MSQENIREILTRYMRKNNMNHSRLSELSGINTGTLSRILKGSNPISVKQLESITRMLGLAEDALFDLYVEECFAFFASMRRIRPFIVKCAVLGRLDCIERIVPRLLDNLSYASALFDVAEELFASKQYQAAAFIYEQVSEAEKFQHSERLALCRYRLFQSTLALGTDLEANLSAAMVFAGYVNRLEVGTQLDALKQLINVMMTVHNWKRVDELAQDMIRIATIQYERFPNEQRTERPLYFYMLYGWLIRGTVCEELGDYPGALKYVSLYAEADWIRETDQSAVWYKKQFSEWATANGYLYRVMSGDADAIDEYADFVADHPEEIFIALSQIVQAANQYGYNIDRILERFSDYIPFQGIEGEQGQYNLSVISEKSAKFFADLAVYTYKDDPGVAINHILEGFRLSISIKSMKNIVTCMILFEQYRESATLEDVKQFKKMSSEVFLLNEEKNLVILGYK